jgi:hypothetical protein
VETDRRTQALSSLSSLPRGMVKLSAKFRNLRIQFKKSFSSSNRQEIDEEVDMQTSPTQTNGRSLGSAVLESSRHLDKCVDSRVCSEDNKENNASVTDQSCKSSPKTVNKIDARKIHMKCSEVPNTNSRHKKLGAIDNLSPTSVSSAASVRGRKGSDYFKYSSIADNNFIRVPSAKTISDRMLFAPSSASSSEQKSLSPATQQIMKEVDDAYMSSPIPASYLRSKEAKRTPSSSTGIRLMFLKHMHHRLYRPRTNVHLQIQNNCVERRRRRTNHCQMDDVLQHLVYLRWPLNEKNNNAKQGCRMPKAKVSMGDRI